MGIWEKITAFFQDWFNKLTDGQKRRLVLICTAVFAVLLTFSVILSMVKSANRPAKDSTQRTDENERPLLFLPIPREEIFLPDEPDFVPGVLLERERRSSWTEDDAMEYWQDPLRFGEEQWREKIEAAIDDFLERVP